MTWQWDKGWQGQGSRLCHGSRYVIPCHPRERWRPGRTKRSWPWHLRHLCFAQRRWRWTRWIRWKRWNTLNFLLPWFVWKRRWSMWGYLPGSDRGSTAATHEGKGRACVCACAWQSLCFTTLWRDRPGALKDSSRTWQMARNRCHGQTAYPIETLNWTSLWGLEFLSPRWFALLFFFSTCNTALHTQAHGLCLNFAVHKWVQGESSTAPEIRRHVEAQSDITGRVRWKDDERCRKLKKWWKFTSKTK